ncbi:MAG: PAS domain S-box protein, partial [Vulcanimicrobiaceae bacterium]
VGDSLSLENQALLASFLAASTRIADARPQAADSTIIARSAPRLFSVFNESTEEKARVMLDQRLRVRQFILGGSLLIVIVAGILFFAILRPTLLHGEFLVDELNERRERFMAIFEGSPDPMVLYSADGVLTTLNPAAEKMFGYGPAAIGQRFDVYVAANSKSRVEAAFSRVRAGESTQYDATFLREDGREIPVAATLFPINVGDKVLQACGIIKDLTAITEAQRALRESSEYFRSLFQGASDPMALYDLDGNIVRGNAASASLLGLSAEVIGKPYTLHVAPEMRSSAEACFTNALLGRPVEFETIFLTAGNLRIPVLASLSPIKVDGAIVGIFGVAKDLTEMRMTEEAMVRSENEFRSLFDFNPDASLSTDLQSRIVRVNSALEEMLGKRSEQLLMTNVLDLVPDDERSAFANVVENIHDGEISTIELPLVGPNGKEIETVVRSVPMFAQGVLSGAFYFLRDVTALRVAERREALQRERLGAIALLATAHAIEVAEQIERTLSFGLMSFGMQAGSISVVQSGEMVTLYGMGQSVFPGTRTPIERTYARHFFGASEPFCISDIEDSEFRTDPGRDWQPWQSLIGATIFVGGVPKGVVIFFGLVPKREPFDDGDRSFLQVIASLIGSAMERDRQQQELSELALTDALTGLPNRPAFNDALRGAVARARRSKESVSVLFCDLDGFKSVNDSHGHEAGDALVRACSDRLRATLREGDYVARIGGDEFLVFRCDGLGDDGGQQLAERIVMALSRPFELDGFVAEIDVSVGYAVFPEDAQTPGELVRIADEAMYVAKAAGKGQVARTRREREVPTA